MAIRVQVYYYDNGAWAKESIQTMTALEAKKLGKRHRMVELTADDWYGEKLPEVQRSWESPL